MENSALLIFVLKILLSPLLIAVATLLGRRYGPAVSGWFSGFPFVSAPISIIMALQHGVDFAGNAAIGTIGGQASVCMFAITYLMMAKRFNWIPSLAASLVVFFLSAAVWRSISLALLPTLIILFLIVLILVQFAPARSFNNKNQTPPWWDLPTRMATAAVFVATLTSFSLLLGPQLSGILSAFPVFGIILATFTHAQQGGQAVRQLLRGTILGSFGIAGFYGVISWLLPLSGSIWIYLMAAVGSLAANWISLKFALQKKQIQPL